MILVSLLRPNLKLNLASTDALWRQVCAGQLVDHLGIQNGERIAAACTDAAFELVPCDPDGRCFIDVPEDIRACPGFDDALEALTGATEAHVADGEFGIDAGVSKDLDGFRGFDDLASLLDDPSALPDIQAEAAQLMDAIVADAQAIWTEERSHSNAWYGNVYEAVAGQFLGEESVCRLDNTDVPPISQMPLRQNVFWDAWFLPSSQFPFTRYDVQPGDAPALEAEASLPNGYRAESWLLPAGDSLCDAVDTFESMMERTWEPRGLTSQAHCIFGGPFAINGMYFHLYSDVFRSDWQTFVVGGVAAVVEGRVRLFALSKPIENDRAADEEYPDRVVAAIEGALRSVAARIAGARRSTGNAMLCAPAFTSTGLVRISTSLGRGYVPMAELTAALGAAAEEAVSKRYQTPISAETVDTSSLYGAEFESRAIRIRLPEQRRSTVYLIITRTDDCFAVEQLTTNDYDDDAITDAFFDVQEAVMDALDGLGGQASCISLMEPHLSNTVLEVFVPHFLEVFTQVLLNLADDEMLRLFAADGLAVRVERSDETDEDGVRVVEVRLHDGTGHYTCYVRALLHEDTATVTCDIIYNTVAAPTAEDELFLDDFALLATSFAQTLFAVAPVDSDEPAEPWSLERALAFCSDFRDALGEELDPPYLDLFTEVDDEDDVGADAQSGEVQAPEPVEIPASAQVAPQQAPQPTPASQPVPEPQPAAAPPTAAAPQPAPKFCYACGTPIAPGARFCTNCGTQIAQ